MSTVEEGSGQYARIDAPSETTESKLSSLSSALPKNLNLYWAAITGIFLWFFFVHTPPFLLSNGKWKDVLLWLHLVGVGGCVDISSSCAIPSNLEPQHLRRVYRKFTRNAVD